MKLKCFAKINWALSVLGKREDGYHELDMIMQSVNLADTLYIEESMADSLTVDGEEVTDFEKNLCFKAVNAFRRHLHSDKKYCISLQKQIPIGAGMGGGSADAAGVLVALNEFHAKPFSLAQLQSIGKAVGADVPFMLQGGSARVQGIGEKIQTLDIPSQKILIIFDELFVSTKEVFENHVLGSTNIDIDFIIQALVKNHPEALGHKHLNHLELSAMKIQPKISDIIEKMYACDAIFASMTGSGSAVFALFSSDEKLYQVFEEFNRIYKRCFICDTLDYGLEINW